MDYKFKVKDILWVKNVEVDDLDDGESFTHKYALDNEEVFHQVEYILERSYHEYDVRLNDEKNEFYILCYIKPEVFEKVVIRAKMEIKAKEHDVPLFVAKSEIGYYFYVDALMDMKNTDAYGIDDTL